jgi:hypothetical protein
MAHSSNRTRWFRWRKTQEPDNGTDYAGVASDFADRQHEQRRQSGEWPELGAGPVTPQNLPPSATLRADNRHLSRVGRWTA